MRTLLRVRLVRCLGVIFTPTEPAVSCTVSSTKGGPCRSLRRVFKAEQRPPFRSQWRYSRLAVTTGEWRYEPIFPDPAMRPLAWCVNHLQIVHLHFASRFSTP